MNKDKDFVSFIDEHDDKKDLFVDILEISQAYVKFKTFGNNIVMIPMIRILKIKLKEGKENDGSNRNKKS